jgi:hypothetical protein
VIEPERQFEPYPQDARHHLDGLIVAGVIFPGVSQGFGGGLSGVCFRMHGTGITAQLARR